ncbi:universal stress protein [Streptomyces sp. V2]|uniref:universal stress protein n=1 Tax=Streptomyces sp. V2 TaxID=1424099 RepID=UPI000D670C14|nr:universal stress protein [Streptomyces sp. V2]PWG15298.1 universal stress protein [Streptomyces sp. V2]
MTLPVVVGVDGSASSLRAVDYAADEAALRGAPLHLVHAFLWGRYESSGHIAADDILRTAERRAALRRPDVPVSLDVLPEEPEYALVRAGREASLLVVGTRGRGGLAELLLGSVSLAVAARAGCPVIVVRGEHDPRGRVVVGIGDRGTASAALDFAVEETRLRHAALDAVRAWRCPARESSDHPLLAGEPARLHEQHAVEILDQALKDAPADVGRRTVEGSARTALLTAAEGADLLVVGARRHPGHTGLQLGRVAHGVLHHSSCAVAVVPEPA